MKTAWVGLACLLVGAAPAQELLPTSTRAAARVPQLVPLPQDVLAHEPPAIRQLLQQANAWETTGYSDDTAWQAAGRYCAAARLGSIEAQYRLGMLYAFGHGVPENRALAAALFSQAAGQGHAEAAGMLESIQMTSAELPRCITRAAAPERAPTMTVHGLPLQRGLIGSEPEIDRYLLKLPPRKRWIVPLATTLSTWYALDPKLVLSIIAVESNFEQRAQSPKEARGLMQLIPDTAERFNVRNAYNATQNLRGGMAYLRWLLSYYRGNIAYALAAYNAGEKRVDHYHGVPPFPETRAYVRRVLGLYGNVRHAFDANLTEASPWLKAAAR